MALFHFQPALVTFILFGAILCRVADASDNGDGPSGLGDKPCPGFRCSKGLSPVQKARSKFISTGCSKMGGGMMMMGAGSGDGNEKYAVCCDRWHACYQTCGALKKSCDDGFKSCSERTCAGDEKCKSSSDLNSMMLQFGGCQKYDQAQYGACECVKKEKREEKRAAALRSFYKKFAPDGVDKVDALAKKVDSTSKLAALFRKLHTKYPESIKVVIDDEMARMQDMMKGAGDKVKVEDVEDVDDADVDDGETQEL